MTVTVHQVAVQKVNTFGGKDWEMLSLEQFLRLQIPERVKLLCNGQVKFYDEEGEVIPAKLAVNNLYPA